MNKNFKVDYLSRDFFNIKQDLVDYAKRYYTKDMADLTEASLNTFLIESVAYVGDILSYYLDYQTNETFLATANEDKNIFNLAKSLGFKQRDAASSSGKVTIYLMIPNDGNNEPDYTKAPVIKKGSMFSTLAGNTYLTTEDVKITKEIVGNNYVVARVNDIGSPAYYAIKVYAPVVSGRIETSEVLITNFAKFNKVILNDPKIAEIISVVDSDGNEYHEVSNLTQNIIYKAFYNPSGNPKYILKPVSAQRRFVFDYENNLPYLLFGAKRYRPDEDLTINPIAEPTKFALNRYNNDFLQDEYFEPNHLLNGDSFGIGPENTVLTITYRVNSTVNNNALAGTINKITDPTYIFEDPLMSNDTKNTIISSVQVLNEEDIVGQNVSIQTDEIKNIAGSIYNAQNRAVTAKDYEALSYMMPQKYGSLKRVKAHRDPTSLKNNINLYVVCTNEFGSLTNSNSIIKENLKNWISEYKIITDTVDILDAKIINLGINFTVMVDPNADKTEVLENAKALLILYFENKPQIGEHFNLLDVYRELRKIKDILDVKDVKITNLSGPGYSSLAFDIKQNLSDDGNTIKIPKNAIYEVKSGLLDIIGNAT